MVKRKTDEEVDMPTTARIERGANQLLKLTVKELDISQSTIQCMANGGTPAFCTFIGVGEATILFEIAGAEDNPKRGHRWYDRTKDSIEYVIRNWWLLAFVWGILFEMLMQV